MSARSVLLLPARHLSSCVFAAIIRDTRGVVLSDADRLNHFPASPLVSVTFVIEGDLSMVPTHGNLAAVRRAGRLSRLSVTLPQHRPITSWSPGSVAAVTIGFYPEAWAKLENRLGEDELLNALLAAFAALQNGEEPTTGWANFCAFLAPIWQKARSDGTLPDWAGARNLGDWSASLMARAALAGPGRSIRALERRLQRWSGQSRQSLKFYAAFETLHQLAVESKNLPLSALAHDAGYADQSHMGRAVRRATGLSPARLNCLIETQEAFWCYRLFGARF